MEGNTLVAKQILFPNALANFVSSASKGDIPAKPPPLMPGCFSGGKSPFIALSWLTAIGFETLLFLLTLYKAFGLFIKGMRQPMIKVVIRDR